MPYLNDFNDQPDLNGSLIRMRPLRLEDHASLFAAASDPKIWEQHPVTDRHKAEVFDPYFKFLIDSGGTLAAIDPKSDQIIGCSRYYETKGEPNSVSIGYTFLTRDHWGGPKNFAMKTLMLDHAFETFPEVWLHIGPDNRRSQKATEKIGAKYVREEPMDIVGSNGTMLCYRLTRSDWRANN